MVLVRKRGCIAPRCLSLGCNCLLEQPTFWTRVSLAASGEHSVTSRLYGCDACLDGGKWQSQTTAGMLSIVRPFLLASGSSHQSEVSSGEVIPKQFYCHHYCQQFFVSGAVAAL